MNPVLIFFIIFFAVIAATFFIVVPLVITHQKYKEFVLEHSEALKKLKAINQHYKFNSIKNYDMEHSYDNEDFYENISTRDYLIYQLVYIQKGVYQAMNDTNANKMMFEKYKQEIQEKCIFNVFDTTDLPKNKERLVKMEKKVFKKFIKMPQINFSINVCLIQRKINNQYVTSKENVFGQKEIKSLIGRINNKRGNYYCDKDIWDAICRVERGKVSNKMRFAIYERDGYRCRICGKYYSQGLEIDHIVPIAKGGKSTYENLQTLCHRCNIRKGAD
jgi:hypothetical protein